MVTTLTMEFEGVLDQVLRALVSNGFAKTKTEAVRLCLLHYGEELGIIPRGFHSRAEELAFHEVKRRWRVR